MVKDWCRRWELALDWLLGEYLKELDCERLAVVTRVKATLPLPRQSYDHMIYALLSSWVVWQQNRNLLTGHSESNLTGYSCLPLSGSGVVQFLFCLYRSSLRPCTKSGLESCSALLLRALCSNLLTRPWDRLMKSGRKSSKASWGEKRDIYTVSCLLVGRILYNS